MHIGSLLNNLNNPVHLVRPAKPMLTRIFEHEFKDMQKIPISDSATTIQANTSAISSKFIEQYSTSIVKVNFNIKELQALALSNGYFAPSLVHSINVTPLFKDVTTQIIMLEGEHTFKDALNIIEPFIAQLGSNFYGALLRSGNIIINPYHPLTALAFADQQSTKKYKIVIYVYNEREAMDRTYMSDIIDTSLTATAVQDLYLSVGQHIDTPIDDSVVLQTTANKDNYVITQTVGIFTPVKTTIDPSLGSVQANLSTQQAMLVAHQVIAKGTIAPYYGTSLIFRPSSSSKSKGTAITPCKSANIASNVAGFERVGNGSVCTGSTDGITLKSLAVLNHANLGSAYNRDTLTFGSLRYFDECIYASRNIYKLAGLIDTEVTRSHEYTPDYPALIAYYQELVDSENFRTYCNENQISSTAIDKALQYLNTKVATV